MFTVSQESRLQRDRGAVATRTLEVIRLGGLGADAASVEPQRDRPQACDRVAELSEEDVLRTTQDCSLQGNRRLPAGRARDAQAVLHRLRDDEGRRYADPRS